MKVCNQPGLMHSLFEASVEFLHLRAWSNFSEEVFIEHIFAPAIGNLFLARILQAFSHCHFNDLGDLRQRAPDQSEGHAGADEGEPPRRGESPDAGKRSSVAKSISGMSCEVGRFNCSMIFTPEVKRARRYIPISFKGRTSGMIPCLCASL